MGNTKVRWGAEKFKSQLNVPEHRLIYQGEGFQEGTVGLDGAKKKGGKSKN